VLIFSLALAVAYGVGELVSWIEPAARIFA
jgi:hypothetical protein